MCGSEVHIREAEVHDVPSMADVLARAFADGPMTVWHVPDTRRTEVMREFFAVGLEHDLPTTTSGKVTRRRL
jgi:hypothetical protein